MKRDCLDVIVGVSTSVKFVLSSRFCTLKQLVYAVSRLRSLMKMIFIGADYLLAFKVYL